MQQPKSCGLQLWRSDGSFEAAAATQEGSHKRSEALIVLIEHCQLCMNCLLPGCQILQLQLQLICRICTNKTTTFSEPALETLIYGSFMTTKTRSDHPQWTPWKLPIEFPQK